MVLFLVVIGVADLLHPLRLAAEADVDLHELLAGRGAVPVGDVRPGVVALADAQLFDRLPALLRAQTPFFDHQELPLVVAVPRGSGARIEIPASHAQRSE